MNPPPAPWVPRVLATAGFIGYSPVAPGTMGSLAAALVFFLVRSYLSTWPFAAGLLILFALAIWSSQQMVARESRDSGKIDPQEIVIDEVAGMMVTLAFVPLNLKTIGLGFLLFRIFDVTKPFPARRAEKLPGGWGIVMDDVVAGIYANVVLRFITGYAL
ncbi:MAG: phosphatidylglycerophosphatase A [candidate division KSB1 bacterium]|nr:phosphatidylglycerophosphatase A [candidate division KSB1 bacterium]MDZ7368402.1 phosphatidylglycerophosphatase A [candidate division KSB1 bacterium]MDZ7406022.1 phosphatidylglycerophosphatase A [candidate division KSB1 bacterium]